MDGATFLFAGLKFTRQNMGILEVGNGTRDGQFSWRSSEELKKHGYLHAQEKGASTSCLISLLARQAKAGNRNPSAGRALYLGSQAADF